MTAGEAPGGADCGEVSAGRLRILHVEDDPDDAELVEAALEADGIACEIRVVDDRESFLAAIASVPFDLILSDFSLPAFNGFSALALARERAPGVPFIIVSGTLGEEAAIDSLQAGATDYVLKHRLGRLAPATRRALAEAEERRRRRQAEEALQNEQQFLKAVLDSLEAGVVACDSRGLLTLFNRAAREMHGLGEEPVPPEGWAERYGLRRPDGVTPLSKEEIPLYRALQGERIRNAEVLLVPKDGRPRTCLVGGQPIVDARGRRLGAVVAMHDISERKHLEDQLRQAQKMEAIGRLAGGVAHDFNNLLNVIMGYSELLLGDLDPDAPQRARLDQIRKAAERAASLTRQLLAFSRKQVLQPRVIELGALLADMEKMLRRLIGEDIDLRIESPSGAGRVLADPGQIEQVVMNLAVNARDAMPEGGRLVLATSEVDLGGAGTGDLPGTRPGAYVLLSVADTGTGMAPDVLSRIFEPFFTTKEPGKGTGLGLATVYGIVKQSGGSIDVKSAEGRGTEFRIYLPRAAAAVEAIEARPAFESPRGTETVLVVEDESSVRQVIRDCLRVYGYTVLETGDPEDAVRLCQEHPGDIHLLLTDLVMPKMSGRALAGRIQALRPGTRILFMSGYTDDAIVHRGILERDVAFLQKPFVLTALVRKVREVLIQKTSAGS